MCSSKIHSCFYTIIYLLPHLVPLNVVTDFRTILALNLPLPSLKSKTNAHDDYFQSCILEMCYVLQLLVSVFPLLSFQIQNLFSTPSLSSLPHKGPIIKTAFIIYAFTHIHLHLSLQDIKTFIHAFLTSGIDQNTPLLVGLSFKMQSKLQYGRTSDSNISYPQSSSAATVVFTWCSHSSTQEALMKKPFSEKCFPFNTLYIWSYIIHSSLQKTTVYNKAQYCTMD